MLTPIPTCADARLPGSMQSAAAAKVKIAKRLSVFITLPFSMSSANYMLLP